MQSGYILYYFEKLGNKKKTNVGKRIKNTFWSYTKWTVKLIFLTISILIQIYFQSLVWKIFIFKNILRRNIRMDEKYLGHNLHEKLKMGSIYSNWNIVGLRF